MDRRNIHLHTQLATILLNPTGTTVHPSDRQTETRCHPVNSNNDDDDDDNDVNDNNN